MKRSTFFLTLIGATALGISPAQAAETCYDSGQQSVGQKFLIGNSVQAEHLKVHFRDYRHTGVKAVPGSGVQFVEVKSAMQVGSNPSDHGGHGTLTLQAKSGEVKSFGIGGAPVTVDDVRFTPNAP